MTPAPRTEGQPHGSAPGLRRTTPSLPSDSQLASVREVRLLWTNTDGHARGAKGERAREEGSKGCGCSSLAHSRRSRCCQGQVSGDRLRDVPTAICTMTTNAAHTLLEPSKQGPTVCCLSLAKAPPPPARLPVRTHEGTSQPSCHVTSEPRQGRSPLQCLEWGRGGKDKEKTGKEKSGVWTTPRRGGRKEFPRDSFQKLTPGR